MNLLEERYRRVLRLLPVSYRAEWEDEMVATFMEAAGDVHDDDGPKPSRSEIASVAALAVRVRLGGVGASPRSLAWGEAVRLAALLGLLVLAVLGGLGAVSSVRLYVFGLPPELGLDYNQVIGPAGSAERLWNIASRLAGVTWTAAYVLLICGRRRAAHLFALLALVPDLASLPGLASLIAHSGSLGIRALAGTLPAIFTVLALLAGFHRDAPAVRRGAWFAALLVGAGPHLAMALVPLTLRLSFPPAVWTLLGAGGLYCLVLVAAGVAYLGVHGYAPARRTPSWPLALILLAIPVLAARIAAVPYYLGMPGQSAAAAVVLGQIAAVTLLVSVLAVLSARMVRPLPASPGHRSGTAA